MPDLLGGSRAADLLGGSGIMKTLTSKIKSLELNQSLLEGYVQVRNGFRLRAPRRVRMGVPSTLRLLLPVRVGSGSRALKEGTRKESMFDEDRHRAWAGLGLRLRLGLGLRLRLGLWGRG